MSEDVRAKGVRIPTPPPVDEPAEQWTANEDPPLVPAQVYEYGLLSEAVKAVGRAGDYNIVLKGDVQFERGSYEGRKLLAYYLDEEAPGYITVAYDNRSKTRKTVSTPIHTVTTMPPKLDKPAIMLKEPRIGEVVTMQKTTYRRGKQPPIYVLKASDGSLLHTTDLGAFTALEPFMPL